MQEYPEVCRPLGRVHIDLTGELPTTEENGYKYIMDFHTKFVWQFAIKTEDAIAIADQIVTELYCRWGVPENLVSDWGAEIRNKLIKRINPLNALRGNRAGRATGVPYKEYEVRLILSKAQPSAHF